LDYNLHTYENIRRYDVINGVTTGPFNEVVNAEYSRRTRVTSSVKTPNYGYLRAHGLRLPENPYHLTKEKVEFPRGYPFLKLTWIPTGDYSTYHGPIRNGTGQLVYLQPTQSMYDRIDNQLRVGLLSKIQGQKVHLGNFYAQRHQMIDEIASTARRLAKAFKAVKRGNFGGAYKALDCLPSDKLNPYKSAASNWLALQYGWLPLLSDLYGITQELDDNMVKRLQKPPIQMAVKKLRLHDADLYLHPGTQLDHQNAKANREYIFDYRGRINYIVNAESAHLLSEIGLTNPLAVAWEVLPYSFVVDWFIPVGNWVNTLDATLGCTFLSGTLASELHSVFLWSNNSTFVTGGFRYQYTGCKGFGQYFDYRRVVLSGFPVVYLPQPKDPFSKGHVLNALALLSQAFFK